MHDTLHRRSNERGWTLLTYSAAEGDGTKPGKAKLSRKERAKLKKDAKRQERKTGSDDEDLAADAPAFKVAD